MVRPEEVRPVGGARHTIIAFEPVSFAAADRACKALSDALGALPVTPWHRRDFDPCATIGREVELEEPDVAAGFARRWLVSFEPSEGFRDFVAAVVALNPDRCSVEVDDHGWPILSLLADSATMAEPAGASSSGRGGLT